MASARRIDYFNIALMMFAFAVALMMPFGLFLFSYAVLGPLHYVTEISWLNERNFFLKKRKHAAFLVGICVILSAQAIYATLYGEALETTLFKGNVPVLLAVELVLGFLLLLAFFGSWALNQLRGGYDFYLWLFLVAFVAAAAQLYLPYQYNFFSLMLPTLIHVSVFTALFILSGALKQNIVSGYLVFGLYLVLCALFFVPHLLPVASGVSAYSKTAYFSSGFQRVNSALLRLMGSGANEPAPNILEHPFSFQIQAFIAFAYTYHYLNWFSKTGLVGWHRVATKRLAGMLALWLGVIGLYLYDYRIGLSALFFFSLLHVILEFPLNHKVTGQLMTDIRARLRTIPLKKPL